MHTCERSRHKEIKSVLSSWQRQQLVLKVVWKHKCSLTNSTSCSIWRATYSSYLFSIASSSSSSWPVRCSGHCPFHRGPEVSSIVCHPSCLHDAPEGQSLVSSIHLFAGVSPSSPQAWRLIFVCQYKMSFQESGKLSFLVLRSQSGLILFEYRIKLPLEVL